MGKPKYDYPTNTFPYTIKKRLNLLSIPGKVFTISDDALSEYTPRGIRKSALRGRVTDRIHDAAWPSTRRLVLIKRQYKNRFSQERLDRIDRMIEASNATMYSKIANAVLDLKKDTRDKKKRAWSESDRKKHMDYIGRIAAPKKLYTPTDIMRGPRKPIEEFMPRLAELACMPDFKVYRRESKEAWYRDNKVSPLAMKYVVTDRIKKLAVARVTLSPE